jgi:hypothetical protein
MRNSMLAILCVTLWCVCVPDGLHAQDKKQRGDRARITQDDLKEAPASVNTAFDAIRTMRPQWFSPSLGRTAVAGASGTSGGGATEVVVYIDDLRQQSLDDLKTVKSTTIVEMRFLDQNRAIQMRGPGHEMGVIEITTINKRK